MMDRITSSAAAEKHELLRQSTSAENAFEDLKALLEEFRSKLEDDYEVGVYIANPEVAFHIKELDRRGDLFVFKGLNSGGKQVFSAQHYTNCSVQFVALRKVIGQKASMGFNAG